MFLNLSILQEKVPEFGEVLLAVLESDANFAAEMYHMAVGIHLPTGGGQAIWVENIHDAVALVDKLDDHRITENSADRGQRLSTLKNKYEEAKSELGRVCSKLERYIQTEGSTE